ncbi:MAG: tryptophan--tRNA ligase, partial [Acidimicrobiia bacterium]
MSLSEPTAKMAKSDSQLKSRILMLDDADVIRKRIRSAVTDSDPEVRFDSEAKPGISNLLEIMSACTGRSVEDLVSQYAGTGYGVFKDAVADAVIEELAPFKPRYDALSNGDVREILKSGGERAHELAQPYQREVRKAVGIKGY